MLLAIPSDEYGEGRALRGQDRRACGEAGWDVATAIRAGEALEAIRRDLRAVACGPCI